MKANSRIFAVTKSRKEPTQKTQINNFQMNTKKEIRRHIQIRKISEKKQLFIGTGTVIQLKRIFTNSLV